ncbi:hypothetical protein F886_00070 [Acinetobacter sp. NIPH 542]|uniref:hypothetical protein n=1 Tax=Acinetobacter sp. NIPH 542 TaxID=1217688 RepID=UPI0002CF113D|nr:hypothetical protein [Acinetobacter sp. NIPH 542]ENX48269.1 hypothetical protein F886_00070 [Acinetobacter sp. NIPH 542]
MDKKVLLEQFEAIAIQNCWNINKYPAGWDGHGDDEYADEFVNGAWWGFQHQQAKVEELQRQLIEQGQRFNEQAQRVKDLEYKNGDLQKRVDKALDSLNKKLEKVKKYEQDSFDHGAVIGLSSALRTVEQVLKGEAE